MLPKHLSTFEGALWDDRAGSKPVRENYDRGHSRIKSVADFKSTVRHGGFAWPGGYPLYLITSDGAALCFACARKECRNIIDDIQDSLRSGGRGRYSWRVVGCDVNYEDNSLYCDNCSEQIESAYGED